MDPLRETAGGVAAAGQHAPRRLLLQFERDADSELRAELDRRGIRVLRYLSENAVFASSSGEWNLEGLPVRWAGSLVASDKVSPELAAGAPGVYLVILQPDVTAAEGRQVAFECGLVPLDHANLLESQVLAAGPEERVREMAAREEVAYVLPASHDLVSGAPVVGCAGALAEENTVAEYVKVGRGWTAASAGSEVEIAWAVGSVTGRVAESTVRSEIARAFDEWARYARLRFTPAADLSGPRTIGIRFARGAHGDPYAFDGAGRVLGHTFYPAPPNAEPVAGDMHLDDDEPWGVAAGTDIFSVVLHELGHALGLGHSDAPGSVMYPYYRVATALSRDDIAGIRELYGERQNAATPATPPSPTVPTSPPVAPTPPTTPNGTGAPTDTVPPALRIVSPAFTIVSTSAASISFRGTASDNQGVAAVKWATSGGAAGQALGAAEWSAPAIPLLTGNNTVTVRAYDAAGNSNWRAVTVVRR